MIEATDFPEQSDQSASFHSPPLNSLAKSSLAKLRHILKLFAKADESCFTEVLNENLILKKTQEVQSKSYD